MLLKTKIKSYGDEVTDFYYQETPKVDSNHTWLAVINLDSALNKDGNYHPQVFLKECKYIEKKLLFMLMIILVIFPILIIVMKSTFRRSMPFIIQTKGT